LKKKKLEITKKWAGGVAQGETLISSALLQKKKRMCAMDGNRKNSLNFLRLFNYLDLTLKVLEVIFACWRVTLAFCKL
jgi:hypothetical protein